MADRPTTAAAMWRFGVDTDRIPARSTEEDVWDVTPELFAAFRQLAEVVCPILSRCKHRCKLARREGSHYALKQLDSQLSSITSDTISYERLNALCKRVLQQEEGKHHSHIAPMPPAPYSTLTEPSSALRTNNEGWVDIDTMYLEPEFRLGSLEFTKFYKHRAMEIRLAFVTGVRDVFKDLLQWSERPGSEQVLAVAELRESIANVMAELAARPFTPLETVHEEHASSLSLPGSSLGLAGEPSSLLSSTHTTPTSSTASIGLTSLSNSLPLSREFTLEQPLDTEQMDRGVQPRAQRRKYSPRRPTASRPHCASHRSPRTSSTSLSRSSSVTVRNMFAFAGLKRDAGMDTDEDDENGEGVKRNKAASC